MLDYIGGGVWCLAPFSKIFQLYCGSKFIGGENGVTRENLSQITDKLYHIKLYQVHLVMNGVRTHNFSGDMLD